MLFEFVFEVRSLWEWKGHFWCRRRHSHLRGYLKERGWLPENDMDDSLSSGLSDEEEHRVDPAKKHKCAACAYPSPCV